MAIEWGFLILLAVGAGWADLRPVLIVLVMAIVMRGARPKDQARRPDETANLRRQIDELRDEVSRRDDVTP